MNTFTRIAASCTIVASVAVALYAFSQSPAASHAEDEQLTSTQTVTTPSAEPAPVQRDTPDVVVPIVPDAPVVVPATPTNDQPPAYGPGTVPGHDNMAGGPGLPAVQLPTLSLPPCPTEDSSDCYWDAAKMGNGQGVSFVNINGVSYYAQ